MLSISEVLLVNLDFIFWWPKGGAAEECIASSQDNIWGFVTMAIEQ